jgi:hypothetical protein
MTSKKALIYKLLPDAELFDRNQSLITTTSRDDKNFNSDILNTAISVKTKWPSGVAVFVAGTRPVDYLLCGPRYIAVSQSAKDVIERIVGSGIEFLPVNVLNEDSKESIGQYWVLNVLNNINALDWEHTRWISDEIPYYKPDAYLNIIKPAFKLKLVEDQHMFLLRVGDFIKSGIYISATLRKSLEAKRATVGMDFMPIKVL